MKANIIIAIIVSILVVAGLGIFSGYQWSESSHSATVAALNAEIYKLGVKVQKAANQQAEAGRQLKEANLERNHAIKTKDHANRSVQRLQDMLDRTSQQLAGITDRNLYRVVDVAVLERVYMEARNECHGLSEPVNSSILPTDISTATGDHISETIKYLAGQYCSVALDYNNLYKQSTELLARKARPDI